jgi:uncharacterized repeat protein (TIGR02543 family)
MFAVRCAARIGNRAASPASGWQFDSWTGDASGTTNPVTVVMDGDKSVTANYTALSNVQTLRVVSSGMIITYIFENYLNN